MNLIVRPTFQELIPTRPLPFHPGYHQIGMTEDKCIIYYGKKYYNKLSKYKPNLDTK